MGCDFLELNLRIERHFGIDMSDAWQYPWDTVGDLVETIQTKLSHSKNNSKSGLANSISEAVFSSPSDNPYHLESSSSVTDGDRMIAAMVHAATGQSATWGRGDSPIRKMNRQQYQRFQILISERGGISLSLHDPRSFWLKAAWVCLLLAMLLASRLLVYPELVPNWWVFLDQLWGGLLVVMLTLGGVFLVLAVWSSATTYGELADRLNQQQLHHDDDESGIFQQVCLILNQVTGIQPHDIRRDSHLLKDIGLD